MVSRLATVQDPRAAEDLSKELEAQYEQELLDELNAIMAREAK